MDRSVERPVLLVFAMVGRLDQGVQRALEVLLGLHAPVSQRLIGQPEVVLDNGVERPDLLILAMAGRLDQGVQRASEVLLGLHAPVSQH